MTAFRDRYLSDRVTDPLRILDVGSLDVNGSYREIFSKPPWAYIGLDQTAGKNVDIVLRTPYVWTEVASGSADVVISGQAFEHIQYFWITILEIARVLRAGGLCCLLAPSSGPEHRYPVDCWRFYPDGMIALAQFAQMEILEVVTQWENVGDAESDLWHDSMLVCRKPDHGTWLHLKAAFRRWVQRRANTMGLRSPPDLRYSSLRTTIDLSGKMATFPALSVARSWSWCGPSASRLVSSGYE
jgi:SAM-dependent methyltransferase